jgi:hypothetical protein
MQQATKANAEKKMKKNWKTMTEIDLLKYAEDITD